MEAHLEPILEGIIAKAKILYAETTAEMPRPKILQYRTDGTFPPFERPDTIPPSYRLVRRDTSRDPRDAGASWDKPLGTHQDAKRLLDLAHHMNAYWKTYHQAYMDGISDLKYEDRNTVFEAIMRPIQPWDPNYRYTMGSTVSYYVIEEAYLPQIDLASFTH